MFVWECIKTEGKHLGTCVDGFLFGSCCGHNDTHNSIDLNPNLHQTSLSSSGYEKPSTPSSVATTENIWSSKPTAYTTTAKPTITTSKPIKPISVVTMNTTEYNINNNVQSSQNNIEPQLTPSSIAKPWPTAPSPIHCKLFVKYNFLIDFNFHNYIIFAFISFQNYVLTAQVWPIQSNTPANVLHTFRPPIFSIFSTYRPPPGSNIFLRPTFRPPIAMRPTSIYQQIFNTRSTTTSTPVNNISTSLSSISPISLITTDIPIKKPPTTSSPATTLEHESSNIVSQTYTKKPLISMKGNECRKAMNPY